ncbi:MAG: hypothetical protein LZF60_80198 [Nitrospira sp.]|nr:MAG: hypothetical protein LZF60_80198 [Nitrospira sp.]
MQKGSAQHDEANHQIHRVVGAMFTVSASSFSEGIDWDKHSGVLVDRNGVRYTDAAARGVSGHECGACAGPCLPVSGRSVSLEQISGRS